MKIRVKQLLAGALVSAILMGDILGMSSLKVSADYTGVVTAYALNIRSSTSTSSAILGVLPEETVITIHGKSGDWYQMTAVLNGQQISGYVHSKYVDVSQTDTASINVNARTPRMTGYVNEDALNFRTGPSTSYAIIRVLYRNTEVTILGTSDDWYYIQVGTETGYVLAQYITVNSTDSEDDSDASSDTADAKTFVQKGRVTDNGVNVRSSASTSSTVLAVANADTIVTVTGMPNSEWYSVTLLSNGKTVNGYIYAQYVELVEIVNSYGSKLTFKTMTKLEDYTGSNNGNTGDSDDSGNTDDSGSTGTIKPLTGKVDTASLNIRTGPGTSYQSLGYLSLDTEVTILEEALDSNNETWYKVTTYSNGLNLTGYVSAKYIRIITFEGGTTTSDMEEMLAQFPESYREGLRSLLIQHPNWIFEPYNTGLNWDEVVQAESKFGVSTVQVSSMTSSTNFALMSTQSGAYDWATDTYTIKDGTNWYTASTELVAHYLDPRNFFDEKYIFSFQLQAYDESQTIEILNTILEDSFMSGSYTETDPSTGKTYTKTYAETYMEAAEISGASPYFLATRTIGEVGYAGNSAVNGKHSLYPGYYNFYSIGAADGGDALTKGIEYAMETDEKTLRPWNTIYKAIVGGAIFNANNYINQGQNTPYFQRFNVVNKDKLYWHQYMTSIHGVASQASMVQSSYKESGFLDTQWKFVIPVYNNMPEEPCTKPSGGNPNPYLKSLTLNSGGLTLTPSFSYNVVSYSIVVPRSTSSVTVSASSVSQFAKSVTGTGTYSLNVGNNTIKVVCTAGNGTSQTYTITIYRQ